MQPPQAETVLTLHRTGAATHKAPVLSHKQRRQGKRVATQGGLAFCLKSNLMGHTVRSRFCSAPCGKRERLSGDKKLFSQSLCGHSFSKPRKARSSTGGAVLTARPGREHCACRTSAQELRAQHSPIPITKEKDFALLRVPASEAGR